MKKITDGLYQLNCNLNITELKKSCNSIYEDIKSLPLDHNWYNNDGQPNAPNTTKSFSQYNILTFPLSEIHNLYKTIKFSFLEVEKDYYGYNLNLNYFIQAWLNVYDVGQFIDWHGHYYNIARTWHGFYCLDVEPSITTYKFTNNQLLDVSCEDNSLIIGLSDNNQHKTEKWHDKSRPRITIAFDIVPEKGLLGVRPNHWIPI
jgi:hypothetical protein